MSSSLPKRPENVQTTSWQAARGCVRKNPYSKSTAFSVARRVRGQTGENIRPYACGNCGNWHIGHDTPELEYGGPPGWTVVGWWCEHDPFVVAGGRHCDEATLVATFEGEL